MTLFTIFLMALATYLTRIGGYLLLATRPLPSRWTAALAATSGSVLFCVIAPHFATGRFCDLLSLALTAFASTRLSLLPTVLVGVISAGLLRHWVGF